MPRACCSFLTLSCIHFFVHSRFFLLQMVLALCRRYAVMFKVFCVPSSNVLWAGFLVLLNDIYFSFVFCICSDSKQFSYTNSCVYAFVFLIQLRINCDEV